jgi:hypothetical protein
LRILQSGFSVTSFCSDPKGKNNPTTRPQPAFRDFSSPFRPLPRRSFFAHPELSRKQIQKFFTFKLKWNFKNKSNPTL